MNTSKIVLGALLGITSGILAGCGDSGDSRSAADQPGSQERKLVLYSWGDYFNEEVFDQFKAETGISVDYQTFENIDRIVDELKSDPGRYDVIVADDSLVRQLRSRRLLARLNHAAVPNLSPEVFDAAYLDDFFDPGNEYTVPYMWGTTLLAYRRDKIAEPEESWGLLFDPALKGRIALLSERTDCYPSMLLYLGYDSNSTRPEEIAEATGKLEELVTEQGVRFLSDVEIKEGLKTGELWVAMGYSGDMAGVAEEEENIGFFIPREGALRFVDNFAISRDSRQIEAAHQFINFMSDGKIAAKNSNYLWYATPNIAAEPYLDEELKADETIYPPREIAARCKTLDPQTPAVERQFHLGWRKVLQLFEETRVAVNAGE